MRSCSRSAAGVCATAVRVGLTELGAVGEAAVWDRAMSPQAATAEKVHSRTGAAQRRRLTVLSRRPANSAPRMVLRANSRRAILVAPPGAFRFAVPGAPRPNRGHESYGFRGI